MLGVPAILSKVNMSVTGVRIVWSLQAVEINETRENN